MAAAAPVNEAPDRAPPTRWRLVLAVAVVVVAALLIAAAVVFPPRPPVTGGGAPPCPSCYSFTVIAGLDGTLTFNGTTPGPAMTVPRDAQVTVTLLVSSAASGPHSWMLVPLGGTSSSAVVFPGANTTDPSVGTSPGGSATARFTASASGTYQYVCGVDSHYVDMWGYFNVTA